ncbi:hypothetical protein L6164_025237 [Bauhinia variegata]|uniref:Uncharacterized protein n=1 Tax=Bauhinia variegata TaxID=167791 RepID=A0ACB9M1S3_BAUVA|nr:hypothetical protein L6164_025237 [Bauhinia variegata]
MEEIIVGVATKILEKLATKAYQEAALAWGLKDEVERLQNSMQFINAFLVDAENKKAGSHSIGVWLRQLKAAFLDAEDVLDEMECEALRNEVVKMHGSATRKVRRFFSSSNPLLFRIKMAHKIKHVKERIDEIASDWKKYGLTEHHPNNLTFITQGMPLRETHSHLDASLVIGRDDEKEELISFLKSPVTHDDKMHVISIVGIGGLGKTTLAKLVYNDKRIIEHFESRIWVCVSDDFDVKRLISEIVKEMGERKLEALSFNQLQSLLREEFPKKKRLLILDDVWNEDRKKWVELSNALLGDELRQNDSKAIVTTRSEEVASIMGTIRLKLKDLPEDGSWKLFVKWAFEEGEEEQRPRLKEIGEQIVKKCKGVPLAVVSLASMLYSKRDVSEWEKVRDNEIWQMDEQKVDILPALRLSYYHLPFLVKLCFSYCSIFPKDYVFEEYDLIYFWMAQGLLHSSNENEDLEHVGKLYIKELISRCFLQIECKEFGLYFFKMHDLVHDLAMSTMQSEIAIMRDCSSATNANKNIRHILISSSIEQVSAFNDMKSKNIRTIGFSNDNFIEIAVTDPFFKWISNKFKYLRVLDLRDCNLESLPDFFRKMKQLRFLSLEGNDELEKVPNSIWTLQNLLYLNIRYCPLEDVPKDMRNLMSLRFLALTTNASSLSHFGFGCFKSLYFLDIVGCDNLVNLPYDLSQLPALKKLGIGDCEMLLNFQEEEEKENIEEVQDLSLEHFIVFKCGSLKFLPSWLQRSKALKHMVVASCKSLEVLPEWLPNMKSLQELEILECRRLGLRCKQDSGPDWPKVAHIPK